MTPRLVILPLICAFISWTATAAPAILSAQMSMETPDDASDFSALMKELDKAIENRSVYDQQKKERTDSLKDKLNRQHTDDDRFNVWGELLDEYRSYDTKLALDAAEAREVIALRQGKKRNIDNARMNRADVLSLTGMYKESLDIMQTIHISDLPDYLHYYYYHIYRSIYGLMEDYSFSRQGKQYYAELTDRYRDSLLMVSEGDDLIQALIRSDQLNVHGQPEEAIDLMNEYFGKDIENVHNIAICSYNLSESYRLLGDIEKQKEYLAISAIADMKTPVREYVALRELAVLIYQEGDIDRAYSYLRLCMEDAIACDAGLRKLEILKIFPIINDAYQQKTKKHQEQLKWTVIIISVLLLALIVAMYFVYKQMRRVSVVRHQLMDANNRLKVFNEELKQYNKQLEEANKSIAENSSIKEIYIGRYMDQCSAYIDKLDNYRRSLNRIATKGKIEDLYKRLKSTKMIDEELKEFYANFDDTFLQLFPTFVEDFNALLREEEQICPKNGDRMTPELRIFALIRLGINDSTKIARFLRYSLSTIYNYRTKVRNKAKGNRDELETKLMEIGR